jgi:tetratricopeptide (TPR) repeat protein
MQKAISWIIAIVPVLLVLTISTQIIDPVLTPRAVLLSAVAAILGLLFIFQKIKRRAEFTSGLDLPMGISWLAYIGFSVVAWFSSVNVAEGLFDLLRIGLIFFVWLLVVNILRQSEKSARLISAGVVISGLILMEEGIRDLVVWQIDPEKATFDWGIVTSTMANRNLYSSALFLTLPFGFWLFQNLSRKWKKWIIIYLVLAVVNSLMVQTRSVQLAFAGGGAIVLILFLIQRISLLSALRNRKLVVAVVGLMWIGAVVPVTVQPGLIRAGLERSSADLSAENTDDLVQSSVNKRLHMWYHTSRMVEESSVSGKGLASWKLILPRYGPISPEGQQGLRYAQRPHNDFLWVLSETGLGGYIGFVTLFLLALCYLILAFFETGRSALLAWLFALVGYIIISSFSFPKERIVHQLFLALILAFAVFEFRKSNPRLYWKMRTLPVVVIMISGVTLACFTAYVSLQRMQGEAMTVEVYRASAASNPKKVVSAASKAINGYYTIDPASTPIPWYRGVGWYQQGKAVEAVEAFEEGVLYNPNHIPSFNNLGSAYVQLGQPEKAIEAYKEALEISPRFTEALCNLSAVYYNLGQNDDAYSTILKCQAKADHLLPETYETYVLAILKRKFAQMKKEPNPAVSHHMMDSLLIRTDYLVDTFRDAANANEDFIEHLANKDKWK